MHALQKQHIVDLFVWVDDAVASLPQTKEEVSKGGRPPALRDSELLTILIWDGLNEPHKTLKAVYSWIRRRLRGLFSSFAQVPELCGSLPPATAGHGLVTPVVATLCRQHHVGSIQEPPSRPPQGCTKCGCLGQELAGLALRLQAARQH